MFKELDTSANEVGGNFDRSSQAAIDMASFRAIIAAMGQYIFGVFKTAIRYF